MPSEKMRYIKVRSGPGAPIEFNDLLEQLRALDKESLSEILWIRAQHDDVLRRELTATVAIRLSAGDFEKGKAAIDFALHLPDFVTYDIEDGYGQILDGINDGIQYLAINSHRDSAIRLGRYAIEGAEVALEKFAEGWDWQRALDRLIELVGKLNAEAQADSAGGS